MIIFLFFCAEKQIFVFCSMHNFDWEFPVFYPFFRHFAISPCPEARAGNTCKVPI